MTKLIAAHTTLAPAYPGYVNVSRNDDGSVAVTVRGDPKTSEGVYICGYALRDLGKPGRCTPGDENCNNYCNSAPSRGMMLARPRPCIHTKEGVTATVLLSAEEWKAFVAAMEAGTC